MDAMIDIETLGDAPDGAIVQIGAVGFDPWMDVDGEDAGMMGAAPDGVFVASIDLTDPHIGTCDAPTAAWWMKQSDDARRRVFGIGERVPLHDALLMLNSWMHSWNVPVHSVWAGPTTYDLTILESAYRRTGMQCPWAFDGGWAKLCDYSTMRWLGKRLGIEEPPFVGVKHDALDDACHQAAHLINILRKVKP